MMCEALYQVHEDLVMHTHFSRGKVKEESASYSVMSDSLRPHGLSMGFSRTENLLEWIAILFSRDLLDPGIESASLTPSALADGFITTCATWTWDHLHDLLNVRVE